MIEPITEPNTEPITQPTTEAAPRYSTDEMMVVAASRVLTGSTVCFVGIGLPSTAANLARLLHAPEVVLIYESGCIGAKPYRLPLSIGDGVLAETAQSVVSVPEIFAYWLQAGRVDVGFLGGAQLDRFGNINSTVVGGDYDHPTVRLPGAGGAPEIAASAGEVYVIVRQSPRTFVDRVDFVSSAGNQRAGLGMRGKGTTLVVTDLGVMRPDDTGELVLVGVHPGITVEQVRAATGWPLRVAAELSVTEAPTEVELATLRALQAAT